MQIGASCVVVKDNVLQLSWYTWTHFIFAKKVHDLCAGHCHEITGVNVRELDLLSCNAGALFYLDPF